MGMPTVDAEEADEAGNDGREEETFSGCSSHALLLVFHLHRM